MFGGIHGTSIVMLGVDQGVLVGADKRAGDTVSSVFTDDAPKILAIHPSGLATGWEMASLKDLKTGQPCADIFKMMRRICRYPQFQFRPDDFGRVGVTWQQMMRTCCPAALPGTGHHALMLLTGSGRCSYSTRPDESKRGFLS
jgi:hypothetical protein